MSIWNRNDADIDARADDALDLNALLHPAQAFAHPQDVVRDPDLTLNEKRAILASWASDACAVEAAPALRHAADGRTVAFDDIIDALRSLDKEAAEGRPKIPPYRRVLANLRPRGAPRRIRRRSNDDRDQAPN